MCPRSFYQEVPELRLTLGLGGVVACLLFFVLVLIKVSFVDWYCSTYCLLPIHTRLAQKLKST